jgi:hypothetical protein
MASGMNTMGVTVGGAASGGTVPVTPHEQARSRYWMAEKIADAIEEGIRELARAERVIHGD